LDNNRGTASFGVMWARNCSSVLKSLDIFEVHALETVGFPKTGIEFPLSRTSVFLKYGFL